MTKLVHISLIVLGLIACNSSPDFPVEPVIAFEGINKTVYNQNFQGTDTIVIQLSFTDGDGDLGDENNALDIEIVDSRTDSIFERPSLPLLPLQGSENGVEGEIFIRSVIQPQSDFCCIPPSGRSCQSEPNFPEDETTFKIRIRDRAGNWSNQVESPVITINCN